MHLLVDTDAFGKLGAAGLLDATVTALGTTLPNCARLSALPHMLRRGSLARKLGKDVCEALLPVANIMQEIPEASIEWLEKLSLVDKIDPGEARLLAVAADLGIPLITGDKRALRAVKDVDGLAEALAGRVYCLEVVLISLCDTQGVEAVRLAASAIAAQDVVVGVCFSLGNPDPRAALDSYRADLEAEVEPLALAPPWSGK